MVVKPCACELEAIAMRRAQPLACHACGRGFIVHLCDWSAQGDVRIKCDQTYGETAWKNPTVVPADADGDGGVYRLEDRRLYTFASSMVTCRLCA